MKAGMTARYLTTAIAAAAALLLGPVTSASAASSLPVPVSANPADWTPQLPLGAGIAAHKFLQVGDTMYVGGAFSTIGGVARNNIAAFNATTGALLPFNPNVNGSVWAMAMTPAGQLIVGGTFTTVAGVSRRGVASVNPTSGAVNTTFNAQLGGNVTEATVVAGRLLIAGTFAKRLAAVDPVTGVDTGYVNLQISGSVASNAGATEVYRFAVNPAGNRLVGIGNFTTVGGQSRNRVFMAHLGATSATLSTWRSVYWDETCSTNLPDYTRDVDFSPDGSYFAIVTTGAGFPQDVPGNKRKLCDTASRWETNDLPTAIPTWINYTGGDTLHSVTVTGATVYVGGHQRWLDNPLGKDFKGAGAVDRPGIGALDSTTGKATTWNPMRTRGIGAKELYVTSAGLWVGSDTDFGGLLGCSAPGGPNGDDCTGKPRESHAGIGFMPLP